MTPDPHPVLVLIAMLGLLLPAIAFLLWAASQRLKEEN